MKRKHSGVYFACMTTFKKTYDNNRGNALVWLLVLVALAIVAFFVFRAKRPASEVMDGQSLGASAEATVIEGEVVCLPHRDTTGPTTLECAYGVKTDEGNYYGLDGSQLPTEKQGGYETGKRVSFEGALLTPEQMPESFWNTYNIVGILQVQDYWEYRDK